MGAAEQFPARASAKSEFLTFGIGDDEYAVAVLRVREILQYPRVTRVPQTPAWIRGVMNLRGNIVPVVDLGTKCGRGASAVQRTSCVLVVEVSLAGDPVVMGIMTDRVDKVVELGPVDIKPVPAFGTPVRPEYLLGISEVGVRLAFLLDIDRVLAADEIIGGDAVKTASEIRGGEAEVVASAAPDATPQPLQAELSPLQPDQKAPRRSKRRGVVPATRPRSRRLA